MTDNTKDVKEKIKQTLIRQKQIKLPEPRPRRQKKIKMTKKTREAFLELLRQTCNVAGSARALGIAPNTIYTYRRSHPEFADEMDRVRDEAIANLEGEAYRRAFYGTEKPVFYKGKQCGTITEYSDSLMVTLLKGNLPEKYANNHNIELTGKDGGPIQVSQAKEKLLGLLNIEEGEILEGEFTEED